MKNFPFERILWALVLIVFGMATLLDNFGIVKINVWSYLWRLWPMFIIIPGLSILLKGKYFWGTVVTLFGVSFLVSNFTSFSVWGSLWPVFIIIAGVFMLFKPNIFGDRNNGGTITDERISESTVFGSLEKKVFGKKFKGGEIEIVFGEGKLDLREVNLANEHVKLEATTVFGTIDVYVDPSKYKVVANGIGVFGSWENKYNSTSVDKPVLEITGTAVFGAVEIKE